MLPVPICCDVAVLAPKMIEYSVECPKMFDICAHQYKCDCSVTVDNGNVRPCGCLFPYVFNEYSLIDGSTGIFCVYDWIFGLEMCLIV